MSSSPQIRQARDSDVEAIASLLGQLSRRYILPGQSPQAAARVQAVMAVPAIRERMAAGHRFHVAEVDGVIAGVVATRGGCHLHHLFVDTRFQRRGIARQLWQFALSDCLRRVAPDRITVNASEYAVPVYRQLGFEELGPPRSHNDIVTTPMVYVCKARDTLA